MLVDGGGTIIGDVVVVVTVYAGDDVGDGGVGVVVSYVGSGGVAVVVVDIIVIMCVDVVVDGCVGGGRVVLPVVCVR